MSLYQKMAQESFPHGARLTCAVCGANQTATVEQVAEYLAHGWPTHHLDTMNVEPLKAKGSAA